MKRWGNGLKRRSPRQKSRKPLLQQLDRRLLLAADLEPIPKTVTVDQWETAAQAEIAPTTEIETTVASLQQFGTKPNVFIATPTHGSTSATRTDELAPIGAEPEAARPPAVARRRAPVR